MAATEALLDAFETHSPDEIRAALRDGADPLAPVRGRTPIRWLVETYTRSPRFATCLGLLLDAGASLGDRLAELVLLDDAEGVREHLAGAPDQLQREIRFDGAYTSLRGVSPLHLAAEFNSIRSLECLLALGADIDGRARVDGDGLGGQTAVFHAVNSNRNHCRPALELLVEAGADLEVRVPALLWGGGCDWETVVFDVTPIAYAQCGLYPQMHRAEAETYANIDLLHRRRYGVPAPIRNVPNRYVDPDFDLGGARGGQVAAPR